VQGRPEQRGGAVAFYREVCDRQGIATTRLLPAEASAVFTEWQSKTAKISY
jgi:hypothetical protein